MNRSTWRKAALLAAGVTVMAAVATVSNRGAQAQAPDLFSPQLPYGFGQDSVLALKQGSASSDTAFRAAAWTGVALSVNAFPAVIAEMARGSYPLEGWVETIPFAGIIEKGIGRLRRQEGMKIVVDVAGRRSV